MWSKFALRAVLYTLIALLAAAVISKKFKEDQYFRVSIHNYREHPVRATLNGVPIGSANGQPHRETDVKPFAPIPVPPGEQDVAWCEGDFPCQNPVHAANKPMLATITGEAVHLGVHLYPDDTVDVIPQKEPAKDTAKGRAITAQWNADHKLTATGCAAAVAAMSSPLSPTQRERLAFVADRVLPHLEAHFSWELGRAKPYADKCRFVATTLLAAKSLDLTRLNDQVKFVALNLYYGEGITTKKGFAPLMGQVRNKQITLDQAMQRWDSGDDRPGSILTRTREVSDMEIPVW
jgi:hypothetical protein